jgi:hypothetical protein
MKKKSITESNTHGRPSQKKRKLATATKRIQDNTAQTMTNKYQVLANINTEILKEVNDPVQHTKENQPKLPPIFIYGVTNYTQMSRTYLK